MLVMPGGADLGYCRTLNGAGNRRIEQFVRRGGAYLGFCAPDIRERILAGAPHAVAAAQLDPAQLAHEAEIAAARGWAIVDEEWLEGVAQIGAAVVVGGEPDAGVGIGMPAHRLDADRIASLGRQAKEAADHIAALLAAHTEVAR